MKLTRALLFVVAGVVIGFANCQRHTTLRIEPGPPPRFALTGPGKLNHLNVGGPNLQREPNRSGEGERLMAIQTYWEIAPLGTPTRTLDDIGSLTYGTIPSGFVQIQPPSGSPPPLVEGDLYNVTFTVTGDDGRNTFFKIRDGKIVAEGQ